MWAIIWHGSCKFRMRKVNTLTHTLKAKSEIAWNKTLIRYRRLDDATQLRGSQAFIYEIYFISSTFSHIHCVYIYFFRFVPFLPMCKHDCVAFIKR